MKFIATEVLEPAEWVEVTQKVIELASQKSWVFRALDGADVKWTNAVFEVSVLSSFDKAWDSRAWKTPHPKKWRYEAWMLREFKRAAYVYSGELPAPNDYLEWLALARHYEMPSRLVDFTYSFYVAAYFALSRKRADEDGFVLALNLDQLKKKTEAKLPSWKFKQARSAWDFHNPAIFRQFAFERKPRWVAPVAPSRKNERLLNQKGMFLCPGLIEATFQENLDATMEPGPDLKLIRFKAPKASLTSLRTDAIRDLKRMNVDMRTLYPDLVGFAQSLRDLVHLDIDPSDVRFEKELKRSISVKPWS